MNIVFVTAAIMSSLMLGTRRERIKDFTVVITAVNHDYREAPVQATVPAPEDFAGAALFEEGSMAPTPCQSRVIQGNKAIVSWIVRDLKKGASKTYRLTYERVGRPVPATGVIVERDGNNVTFRINNELVTKYDTTTGPNKPYFNPIFAPGGVRVTRGWPMETLPGDVSRDHPHHRGLWFTHGEVNGNDFWSEEPRAGKTVNTGYRWTASGAVYGGFGCNTDWIAKDGTKIAEDTRNVRIYNVAGGRLMDFDVTVKALEKPLVFGDTKEGSFGLRMADSMRVTLEKNMKGEGHIETSDGVKDAASWGTRADWVDYYGPVGAKIVGVTIFDHPQNLRHPTYWHVRDYGLFCANPFGIHDFVKDQPKDAGNFTIPAGGSQTWRYRVYIHDGDTQSADVASVWAAYSDPPSVEVHE